MARKPKARVRDRAPKVEVPKQEPSLSSDTIGISTERPMVERRSGTYPRRPMKYYVRTDYNDGTFSETVETYNPLRESY